MADPIPNESTAQGGSSSKRLSEPRLSIGSSGMPKVDFVQPEGESSPAYLYFIYLIGGCCGLAVFAGAIALFVFTVIFLIDDEGKSECWDTTGKAIWTYVIVRIVLGCLSQSCANTAQSESSEEGTAAIGACCAATINLALMIYGGIVLIANDVCDGFKRTGLYKMFYIIYIIEVITNTVMICTMLQVCLQKAGKKDETPAPVDGDETIKIARDETLVNQA